MLRIRVYGFILLSCQVSFIALTTPVLAQSWSSWKQTAQEHQSKGQLAQAEDSWRAALRLVQESGSHDARLFISALELAKVQMDEHKNEDARRLLKNICNDKLSSSDFICEEEISCLQKYSELLKETPDKNETQRIEHLQEIVLKKRIESTKAAEKSGATSYQTSLVFGQAAQDELKNQLNRANKLRAENKFAEAAKELDEALAIAVRLHRVGATQPVLTAQAELYTSMKDNKNLEITYGKLLDNIKQESGTDNQPYLDALTAHANLLHVLGDNNRAALEDTNIAIIASKLKTPVPAKGESASTGTNTAISKPRYSPSSISSNIKRTTVPIEVLMAEVDKGNEDPNLLIHIISSLYNSEQYERCLPYAEKLARKKPDSAKIQLFLSSMYVQLHRAKDAVEPAKRAIDLSPDSESYYNLVSVYAEAGNMSKQLDALKDYVKRFPKDAKTPDYQTQIEHLEKATLAAEKSDYSTVTDDEKKMSWKNRVNMPIRVFIANNADTNKGLIKSDGSGARAPLELCHDALNSWERASGGRVRFQLVDNENSSEIAIFYARLGDQILAENCAAGVTKWVSGYRHAIVYLGLVETDGYAISRERFFSTALHEIGHALGLEHTSHPEDVMFWQQHGVDPTAPSPNDERRILMLY